MQVKIPKMPVIKNKYLTNLSSRNSGIDYKKYIAELIARQYNTCHEGKSCSTLIK
jgi:hypothetical protein